MDVVEEMYGVWSGGCQPARPWSRPKKNWREVVEKTIRCVFWTGRMPWIVVGG